jgi:very-short-patch-repair endonuclease
LEDLAKIPKRLKPAPMKIIPYNPKLKELARRLRKNSTFSEVLLWEQIKNRKLMGCRFLRQKPIDNYIVDFFCPELMLAIEVDGITHDKKAAFDNDRQDRLESLGVKFLRFLDIDIKTNLQGVLSIIQRWVEENTFKPIQSHGMLKDRKGEAIEVMANDSNEVFKRGT